MSLDRLFVSLAFAPDGRVPVGMLSQSGRDSLFQFDESFLASPLPLSPLRLPALCRDIGVKPPRLPPLP